MNEKQVNLRRKYQVKNSNEAIYLETQMIIFDGDYVLGGKGEVLIELGEKNHVNMRPLNKLSRIEEIISKKSSETIWKPKDRFEVTRVKIGEIKYYLSDNPRHHPR